jgi:hypothetical protein
MKQVVSLVLKTGKYVGQGIENVPSDYLQSLLDDAPEVHTVAVELNDEAKQLIQNELDARAAALDSDKPVYIAGLGNLQTLQDFELAHLLGNIEVKGVVFNKLTAIQQEALMAENERRKALEPTPPAVDAVPVPGVPVPVPVPVSDTEAEAAAVAAGTVEEAKVIIEVATTLAQLDAYDAAEDAGKDRTGVRDAIAKRRDELEQ